MDYQKLTAPCGIDCFNCEMFEDNITEEMQKFLAQYKKADPASIKCKGCRVSGCLVMPGECATKKCADARGIEFCHQCDEFPCGKLQPCVDGSEKYPHNLKLFNLCRIKQAGLEKWAAEESANIRRRYKTGKFHVGLGPVIPE